MPDAALEGIIDFHNYLQHQGPFSLKVNSWIEQRLNYLRKEMAAEIGATASEIAPH